MPDDRQRPTNPEPRDQAPYEPPRVEDVPAEDGSVMTAPQATDVDDLN